MHHPWWNPSTWPKESQGHVSEMISKSAICRRSMFFVALLEGLLSAYIQIFYLLFCKFLCCLNLECLIVWNRIVFMARRAIWGPCVTRAPWLPKTSPRFICVDHLAATGGEILPLDVGSWSRFFPPNQVNICIYHTYHTYQNVLFRFYKVRCCFNIKQCLVGNHQAVKPIALVTQSLHFPYIWSTIQSMVSKFNNFLSSSKVSNWVQQISFWGFHLSPSTWSIAGTTLRGRVIGAGGFFDCFKVFSGNVNIVWGRWPWAIDFGVPYDEAKPDHSEKPSA